MASRSSTTSTVPNLYLPQRKTSSSLIISSEALDASILYVTAALSVSTRPCGIQRLRFSHATKKCRCTGGPKRKLRASSVSAHLNEMRLT